MNKERRKKIQKQARSLLVFGCGAFIMVVSLSSGEQVKESATFAGRQAELVQTAKAISIYELDHGYYPQNPSSKEYCLVDERYGKVKCLGELVRDGYFGSLPYTGDEEYPYLYFNDRGRAAIGLVVSERPEDETNDCSIDGGWYVWCIHITSL